ncbi:uncharacterized protein LOC115634068 [Scaptodrosophila lebanonensis]|uniref:Uncharacterized protein LOC115634068 n=1 Tax=Drosophila lebanonensis TaxID=7225 RepID=A0A6J2UIY8_DROLE|nr:uncharacterized protein LOC115634068 [Scaptodrosophila lebanonensis]
MAPPFQHRNPYCNADPSVIELYRKHSFVAESLSSIFPCEVKVTESGLKVTNPHASIDNSRHIEVSPVLPSLKERSSKSSIKNLYELSQQLADDEVIEIEVTNVEHPKPLEVKPACIHNRSKSRSKSGKQKGKKPKGKTAFVQTIDKNLTQDVLAILRKQEPYTEILTDEYLQQRILEMAKQILSEGKVKSSQNEIKPQPDVMMATANTRDARDPDPTESPKIGNQQMATESRNAAQETINNNNVLHLVQNRPNPNKNQSEMCIQISMAEAFQELCKLLRVIFYKIDDWYLLSLLLVVGAGCYLLYIIGYDVNAYVNAERRYRAKMDSSGYICKCFYFLMHMLYVPMF